MLILLYFIFEIRLFSSFKSAALKKPLLEYTPTDRLNHNLRNMMMYYIISEQDGISLEMNDLLYDFLNLFRLLDNITGLQAGLVND